MAAPRPTPIIFIFWICVGFAAPVDRDEEGPDCFEATLTVPVPCEGPLALLIEEKDGMRTEEVAGETSAVKVAGLRTVCEPPATTTPLLAALMTCPLMVTGAAPGVIA